VQLRPLDERRAEQRARRFNAAEYARDLWDRRLPDVLETASDAGELIRLFNTDMDVAVEKGRTLGQSRVHAYLLRGAGRIAAVDKNGVQVSLARGETGPEVLICTASYVSGNAVRDASGLVDVSAFSDTMKFNRISSEINRIVVQRVIRPFLDEGPRPGRTVRFVGAAEVAEDATERTHFGGRRGPSDYHLLRVVPIRLSLE
jgi:predicted lipoprotein